jgi:hypothetical protein
VTCSYYVYYRSRRPEREISAVVGEMQAALARETGIAGRLMRRADDAATWMEVYEAVPDTAEFEQRLAAAVVRFAVDRLLDADARRHVERFVPAG